MILILILKMVKEMINIYGQLVQQTLVPMNGDGACLFRSLSFLMYSSDKRPFEVRKKIVDYLIKQNWNEFSIMSHDKNGDNYNNFDEYYSDMIQSSVCGGLCVCMYLCVVAAEKNYDFVFKVYRKCELYAKVGTDGHPVKRLRFSRDLSNGHIEAYLTDDIHFTDVAETNPCPTLSSMRAKKIISRRIEVVDFINVLSVSSDSASFSDYESSHLCAPDS